MTVPKLDTMLFAPSGRIVTRLIPEMMYECIKTNKLNDNFVIRRYNYEFFMKASDYAAEYEENHDLGSRGESLLSEKPMKSVPVVAGSSRGYVGEAKVNGKGEITALEFLAEHEREFRRDYDLYSYAYKTLPKPHVIMQPIPGIELEKEK